MTTITNPVLITPPAAQTPATPEAEMKKPVARKQPKQTKQDRIAMLAKAADARKAAINGTPPSKADLRKEADKATAEFSKRRKGGFKDVPAHVGVKPAKPAEKSVDDKIRDAKVTHVTKRPAGNTPADKGIRAARLDDLARGGLPFRKGSKTEKIVLMVMEKSGATEAAICKAIGWEACAVTLRRAVAKAGLTLKTSKSPSGETVYQAS